MHGLKPNHGSPNPSLSLINYSTNKKDIMQNFDLRFCVPLVINILKSQAGLPWDWDPFKAASEPGRLDEDVLGYCYCGWVFIHLH